jgi:hypothetical protein
MLSVTFVRSAVQMSIAEEKDPESLGIAFWIFFFSQ